VRRRELTHASRRHSGGLHRAHGAEPHNVRSAELKQAHPRRRDARVPRTLLRAWPRSSRARQRHEPLLGDECARSVADRAGMKVTQPEGGCNAAATTVQPRGDESPRVDGVSIAAIHRTGDSCDQGTARDTTAEFGGAPDHEGVHGSHTAIQARTRSGQPVLDPTPYSGPRLGEPEERARARARCSPLSLPGFSFEPRLRCGAIAGAKAGSATALHCSCQREGE
jgi:hypothetical protein